MNVFDKIKATIIIFLLAVVTVVHHLPIPGFLGTHILHRELFFFPIVLAGSATPVWLPIRTAPAVP